MEYAAATMTAAAECNKLIEVQYLHSQGCPWPAQLLDGLLISGTLTIAPHVICPHTHTHTHRQTPIDSETETAANTSPQYRHVIQCSSFSLYLRWCFLDAPRSANSTDQ
eukprot:6606-Heterococcus_DN1.PRE.1